MSTASAAALAPIIYKGAKGLTQGDEADELKKRNTTPPARAEARVLGRQAVAMGLLGAGAQRHRIEAGTNSSSVMSKLWVAEGAAAGWRQL